MPDPSREACLFCGQAYPRPHHEACQLYREGKYGPLDENPHYGPGNPDWEHDRERERARG